MKRWQLPGRFFLLICSLLLVFTSAHSQNTIGIPTIINYSKDVYNAGTQNWSIAQDQSGIMYFANNQGLLTFDGTFWRKYPLPNKTIVRSVAVDADGKIYVGGQSEFGYFSPTANGELTYTSLMPLIDEKGKDFTDVWNICIFQNRIFFRAYRKVFEYDHKKIIVHDGIHWNFMASTASDLFAFEYNKGLVKYTKQGWHVIVDKKDLPAGINFKSAVSLGKDSVLFPSLVNGLYILSNDQLKPFNTPGIELARMQNIYGATLISDDRIALMTVLGGCIFINKKGEFVQQISKKEGIQNNNVLSLFLDKDKNLWLGLNNGIDLVLYNNAIKNIYPELQDRNAGYASVIYNNQLYLGLASGAYRVSLDILKDLSYQRGNFQPVQQSKGQVWNFSIVNGKLLMGHNSGAYVIEQDRAIAIDTKTGFWDFQPLKNIEPAETIIAGTYNGINIYNYKNGSFINPRVHAHFESARFVVQHNGLIWIAHPFKGLYIVSFDNKNLPQVTLFKDKNHILSDNHNKIFKVHDKMILTTDKGIFEYDDKLNDFIVSKTYQNLFGNNTVDYFKEDQYGNTWIIMNKRVGVLDKTLPNDIVFIPELNNRVQADGFENINIIDSNNILITAEKGFFHLNYAAYKRNKYHLNVLIRNVRSISDNNLLFYGGYNKPSSPSIKYSYNSLRFEASAILYGQEHTLQYSFYLEGFDKSWSEWSARTEKDYTNIPPGRYTFKVKCRNNISNESSVASFSFTILAPWYRTWWAYIIYISAIAYLLYYIYKRQKIRYVRQQQRKLEEQKKKYAEEQKRLEMEYQLEISDNEKRIARLQSEKLQAEVNHKNTELATSAMNLVHKVEILSKIKEDLIHYKETAANGSKEVQKIIKKIDGELDDSQQWEQFSKHFDNVHTDYLKKLKDHCPDLTTSELKLAAYLRLSLTTKEIAQLMNISVRGVETSRYRLRKKLGLTNDEANLYDHLLKITSADQT